MFGQDFLQSAAGKASLDYAEQVYSSLFQGGSFTVQEHPEMFESLVSYHMQPVYAPLPPMEHRAPFITGDDEEEDFEGCDNDLPDHYFEREPVADGLSREASEALVKVSTYTWLCNYKGEQDGDEFALHDLVKNLPIYHSKWNYSNFGN